MSSQAAARSPSDAGQDPWLSWAVNTARRPRTVLVGHGRVYIFFDWQKFLAPLLIKAASQRYFKPIACLCFFFCILLHQNFPRHLRGIFINSLYSTFLSHQWVRLSIVGSGLLFALLVLREAD